VTAVPAAVTTAVPTGNTMVAFLKVRLIRQSSKTIINSYYFLIKMAFDNCFYLDNYQEAIKISQYCLELLQNTYYPPIQKAT
jgi:hypothetical protein